MSQKDDDKLTLESLEDGFDLLCLWSRNIALLPLAEWLEALDHGESIAAITDPTLYREYIYSDKPKILKSLIEAAIPLKKAVLDAQPSILRQMERDSKERKAHGG